MRLSDQPPWIGSSPVSVLPFFDGISKLIVPDHVLMPSQSVSVFVTKFCGFQVVVFTDGEHTTGCRVGGVDRFEEYVRRYRALKVFRLGNVGRT